MKASSAIYTTMENDERPEQWSTDTVSGSLLRALVILWRLFLWAWVICIWHRYTPESSQNATRTSCAETLFYVPTIHRQYCMNLPVFRDKKFAFVKWTYLLHEVVQSTNELDAVRHKLAFWWRLRLRKWRALVIFRSDKRSEQCVSRYLKEPVKSANEPKGVTVKNAK